ncbi:hypothetical protein [Cesiribacter sp. SM1]|uniref:hypothetical protein n=1 Tax=Cesiribacter sp. SM1 TaxID=2861196 RepID=UPI001CD2D650|nr:hypothetical protein [Cesiribacter sp. SM1]
MLVSGLFLAGAGLLLLVIIWLIGEKPPAPDAKRSPGIVLEVRTSSQQLNIRYLAGKDTFTILVPAAQAGDFYVGQQILVDYKPANPGVPLGVHSIAAARGRKFLQLLIAVLVILAGLVLIRMG